MSIKNIVQRPLIIKWRTVAFVGAALATLLLLVLVGKVEVAVAAGAVGTVVGSSMRQMFYPKPEPDPVPVLWDDEDTPTEPTIRRQRK